MSLFCGGAFRRARNYLERSLAHEAQADLVGSDFPSMAMLYLSWTLHMLGYPQRALELYGGPRSSLAGNPPIGEPPVSAMAVYCWRSRATWTRWRS